MSQASAALWLLCSAIFTTGLENSISWASSRSLTLAASGKSFLSLGVIAICNNAHYLQSQMCTMDSRSQGGDTHRYPKTHLQFLSPCMQLHSPIHTELNIQAIYPSLLKFLPATVSVRLVALQQSELRGTEFEIFQSLSNSIHSGDCSIFKKIRKEHTEESHDCCRKWIHRNVL